MGYYTITYYELIQNEVLFPNFFEGRHCDGGTTEAIYFVIVF